MSQPPSSPRSAFPLHVLVEGEGYPILCLHGHPGSARSMSVFTQHLCQRFKTIAPDLRGYGASRPTPPFELEAHLSDLEALLDHLQIARCLVLGWSLGGIFATELALKLPDRISGLVLVATAARPWGDHPAITWQDNLYTGIAGILNRLRPGWQWNIDQFGKRSLFRYLIQQHTARAYWHLAHEALPAYLQTSGVADRALSQALRRGYNRLADLPQIRCPVLVLCGAADRHITAASSLETAKALPNCRSYCYDNVAHLFPWEIPDRVLQDLDQWLADHPQVIQPLASDLQC